MLSGDRTMTMPYLMSEDIEHVGAMSVGEVFPAQKPNSSQGQQNAFSSTTQDGEGKPKSFKMHEPWP